jgi:23S rRNA U2552 (ribose-2'-O)-methylase RlmE/FtsJ
VKGFPGQESDLFRKELRRHFSDVHEVRPEGKRTTSKEFYWVCALAGCDPESTAGAVFRAHAITLA